MPLPPLFIRGKLSEVNLILSVVSYNRQRSHRHLQPALHPAELATGGKWTYNRQCEHDGFRNFHIRVNEGVNIQLSMLRAITAPDPLLNIIIPFNDSYVNELRLFRILLCVSFWRCMIDSCMRQNQIVNSK